MTGQPPRVTARGGFSIPAAVCEFSLDKRNRRRYYVSVSQQNIGYETRKRKNSMGAWFFVAFMIAHKMIITDKTAVVNAITAKNIVLAICTNFLFCFCHFEFMFELFKKKCFQRENMFLAAANVVFDTDQASASMLQRRLKIDYEKAAQLISELETAGIVSTFDGLTPRQILVSAQDFQTAVFKIGSHNVTPLKIKTIISENHQVNAVDGMDGHEFEFWCADLLRKNGFSGVEVTQESGDQGVDVLAQKDGIKYAIQCKCYSSDLGNKPVQEVNAGKTIYHCHVGAVMTNQFFTAGAKQAAEATGVLLWDRNKLMEFLENAKKG